MKSVACFLSTMALVLSLSSCGTLPTAGGVDETARLSVRMWIEKPLSKTTQALQTSWDSLVIVVSSPDMTPVRTARRVNPGLSSVIDTIGGITEGKNRLVEAWTCTREGLRIHYGACLVDDIAAGEIKPVAVQLRPMRGSIYINLANVPANVDSVFAAFRFGADSLTAKAKRSAMMYLSIDNVPDSTAGVLIIRGTDTTGAVIYSDSLAFVFYASQNVTMQAQFLAKPSGFAMSISIQEPGVTLVSGQMGGAIIDGNERGPLIITEIMYYSDGDSDYIEIFNPTPVAFVADTLLLEIVNTSNVTRCRLTNVRIGPRGYFVVGDTDAPNEWCDTVVAMDLTTTGRWIILKAKDGTVIDWVSYIGGDQEWPKAVKLYSIEMDMLSCDPVYNNYGRNWNLATASIAGTNCFGTPGK